MADPGAAARHRVNRQRSDVAASLAKFLASLHVDRDKGHQATSVCYSNDLIMVTGEEQPHKCVDEWKERFLKQFQQARILKVNVYVKESNRCLGFKIDLNLSSESSFHRLYSL